MPEPSLAERVTPPVDLIPAPVDGVRWRPLTLDDAGALVELGRSIAASDHPEWMDSEEEVLEELGHSYTDLARDSLAAVTDDGELAAWGVVVMPPVQETLVRSIVLGGVAPAHRGRGIGRALVDWQRGRALQQLAGSTKSLPGWIVATADHRAPTTGRILERAGFTPRRWFHTLSREIGAPVAMHSVAESFRIVPYSADRSQDAHNARDSAFQGEGSSQPMSNEQWESMTALSTFDHSLSFLAVDANDRVVGLLLTLRSEQVDDRGARAGYVWVLGVRPDSRRRGLARALLRAHLASVRDAGLERSSLDVATDGAADGLELFTSEGYVERSVSVNYVQVY